MWDTLRRWRTWIVNIVFGVILTPDLILALAGYNWGSVIPAHYMPFISIALVVVNVLMRPRPAVLPKDVT